MVPVTLRRNVIWFLCLGIVVWILTFVISYRGTNKTPFDKLYAIYNWTIDQKAPDLKPTLTPTLKPTQKPTHKPLHTTPDRLRSYYKKNQIMVFVHPRKNAGTSLLTLFDHYNNTVYVNIDQWKVDPSKPEDKRAVFETAQEFDTFDLKQQCDRCYVTMGREPISRVISLYYWRIKRGHISGKMTLESYLSQRAPTSLQRDDMYHGFYSWMQQWCGKDHRCTRFASDGEWVLERAKANVERLCGLIGMIDRFDDFVKAGVQIFPQYFGRGDYVKSNSNKNAKKNTNVENDRKVAKASYPPKLLSLETRFYDWMKARSERLYSHLWNTTLPKGTWKPPKLFWESGGGRPPWIGRGGYRRASFDSPNDPKKQPDLW